MICRFTLCDHIVMTADATTDDFVVIQWCNETSPRCWRDTVACLAHIGCAWMCCGFTSGNNSVMTTEAGTNYLQVVDR